MRDALAVGLGALVFGALLSGCDDGPRGDPAPPAVNVPMYRGEPNGDDAAVVGTLVEQDGCLLLEADGGETMQVAFPASWAGWDDTAGELTLGGETFRAGDRVQFGGSAHPLNRLTAVEWETAPADRCEKPLAWLSQEDGRLLSR
jgi:hypothetical protein